MGRLEQRVAMMLGVSPDRASRVVAEVVDAFSSTVDDFIADRHLELKRRGWRNDAIYERIAQELADWRFRAPELTERQIRRRIYG